MKRILILYFSQSGDVHKCAEAFAGALQRPGVEIVWEQLRPTRKYPYPWRNMRLFFNQMPECITENPPPIEPMSFSADEEFDLVILAYQVWFLSPSLPTQAFFRTEHAKILRDTKVITLTVSRNMWHNASETMKGLLAEAQAVHTDNVVVTHQGPELATFVTTTRSLLTGKRNRMLNMLPESGIAQKDFERLRHLGDVVASQLDRLDNTGSLPLLRGEDTVEVKDIAVYPELGAYYCFRFWGRTIRLLERVWKPLREVGVFLFGMFLLSLILVGIPLALISTVLILPLMRKPLRRRIAQLKKPTGTITARGPETALLERAY